MMESQLWVELKGKVSKVPDGRTVVISLDDDGGSVEVTLVAIKPSQSQSSEAMKFLALKAQGQPVSVLTNSDWAFKKKEKVVGIVRLSTGEDLGLALIEKHLATFSPPKPYQMSRYTECEYRIAQERTNTRP